MPRGPRNDDDEAYQWQCPGTVCTWKPGMETSCSKKGIVFSLYFVKQFCHQVRETREVDSYMYVLVQHSVKEKCRYKQILYGRLAVKEISSSVLSAQRSGCHFLTFSLFYLNCVLLSNSVFNVLVD